jgi:hypothetical protein
MSRGQASSAPCEHAHEWGLLAVEDHSASPHRQLNAPRSLPPVCHPPRVRTCAREGVYGRAPARAESSEANTGRTSSGALEHGNIDVAEIEVREVGQLDLSKALELTALVALRDRELG